MPRKNPKPSSAKRCKKCRVKMPASWFIPLCDACWSGQQMKELGKRCGAGARRA